MELYAPSKYLTWKIQILGKSTDLNDYYLHYIKDLPKNPYENMIYIFYPKHKSIDGLYKWIYYF